jgi:amino acid permease
MPDFRLLQLLHCATTLICTLSGMAALPRAFSLLGLGVASILLLGMGYMTHFSIQALILGSVITGSLSYGQVVRTMLGQPAEVLLEASLVVRCAGLMVVYVIVAADQLAGEDLYMKRGFVLLIRQMHT